MKKYTLFFAFCSLLAAFFPIQLFSQCSSGQHEVKVSLEINGAWTKLGWDMFDIQGNPVMSRLKMPSNSSNSWVYDSACVATNTVLKFRIFDGKGFGLCCEYGDGTYIVEVDGQQVVRGGAFFRPEESFIFQVNKPQVDANLREIYLQDTLASYVHWIRGRVYNSGQTPISSFRINWTIGQEGVRSHEYSGLNIQPGEEFKWTHPYGWDASQMGTFGFKSWISEVNGAADMLAANDSIAYPILIYKPLRNVLTEYITNFYCGPCADWMHAIKERVNMNQSFAFALGIHSDGWGGLDVFYLASPVDNKGRYDYYGVSSHPNARLMGLSPGSYPAKHITTSRLQAESRLASPFEISVPVVSMMGNQLSYSAEVSTPNGHSEGNLVVHVGIVERHAELPTVQPNGEHGGDWVMRKMLPDYNGTPVSSSWTAGQTHQVQGSFNITNALNNDNLGVLVFVQNSVTKKIYNVNYAPVKGPDTSIPSTGIDNPTALRQLSVYPNPVQETLFVETELSAASQISLRLVNAQGQIIRQLAHPAASGSQAYRLEVEGLASGLYFLSIYADGVLAHSQKVWKR